MEDLQVASTWRSWFDRLEGKRVEVATVLGLVAALVAVALVVAGRVPEPRVAPPAGANDTALSSAPTGTAVGSIHVHVAGLVRHPGLYELPAGARVADAVQAAGGPTKRGDLDALNLAQVLTDGLKVEVLGRGAGGPAAAGATPGDAAAPISLNGADQTALETIPGIGPVTALAILSYRDEIGGFSSLSELLEVDGIGPATLDSIVPYLTL